MEFETIFNQYKDLVYYIAFSITKNNDDSQDISQEVFMSYYMKAKEKPILNIKFYLSVSTKNTAINLIKSKNQYNDTLIEETSGKYDTKQLTKESFKELDDIEFSILLMKYQYGFSIKQIAITYDVAEITIKRKLKVIKEKIKEEHNYE